MSYLEIEQVGITYSGNSVALKSVSFNAERGEIIAIIGRSGSGKSTMLRCINALQPLSSGLIRINGKNISQLNQEQICKLRTKIGFIWQEHNLIERFSTMMNVLTGRLGQYSQWLSLIGYFDSQLREKALHNLERVKLLHRAQLRADRLSGGEKQRAAIARALTQDPEMILADEPVASLDPELALDVLNLLTKCCREDNVLSLISIHNVEFAKQVADRIVALADGMIIYDGPPTGLNKAVLEQVYKGQAFIQQQKIQETNNDFEYEPVVY